jgi:glycosyltransferase involved in cell wall biosynthesis
MTSVLFINYSNELGGAEQSLLSLLSGLDGKRYSPVLLTFGSGPLSKRAALAGAEVIALAPLPALLSLRREGMARRLLALLAQAPALFSRVRDIRRAIRARSVDIVHTNNPKSHVLGACASLFLKKRLVFHMRDIFDADSFARFLFALIGVLIRPECIAISNAVRDRLPSSLKSRSRVIVNGLRPPVSLKDRKEVRAALGIPGEARIIVSAGRIVPWKGIDCLVRAAAPLLKPGACYLVVLGAPLYWEEAYLAEVQGLARALSIEDCVRFPGWVEDVFSVLNASDLFVLPSRNEPFGRSLVEAMLCGLPVVAFREAGPMEIVEDTVSGRLVDGRGPEALREAMEALREAMEALLADMPAAARMGARGKASALARFSLDRMINSVEQFYAGEKG